MRRRRPWGLTITLAVVLTLALASTCLLYRCTADDCVRRGGHVEPVYGGRSTAWTCDGATGP